MENLVLVARSTTNNIPSTLSYGEIAVFFDATGQSQFYVGNQNNLPTLLNDDAIIITSIQSTVVNKPTVNGFYIFTATPLDGLPIGIALNDIAYLYNNVWYLTRSYFSAPATIKVGLVNQNVFTKNSNTWATLQNSIITGTSAKVLYKGRPVINARTSPVGLITNGTNGNGIQVSTASPIANAAATATYVGTSNAVDTRLLNAFIGSSSLNVTQIPIGAWTFRFSALASAATGASLSQSVYQVVAGTNAVTITGAGANSRTATLTSGQFSGTNFQANASNILASYIQTPSGIYQITSITSTNVATITVPTGYVNQTGVTFSVLNFLFSTSARLINTTTIFEYVINYQQTQVYNVGLTDKLCIIDVGVFSTANRTITVSYDGQTNANSVTTSIPLNHNDLPNIGNGANLNDTNHLTNAEYGNVALIPTKADKIPNSLALSNFATGGVIGLANATVDIFEGFDISQTTTSQALTLPTPTTTTNTKIVYVKNVGTASFTMYNVTIQPNTFLSLIYNTLNGWLVHSGSSGGASGSTIYQVISTPLANAIANSVTTVSNIKVRYNANGTGGNLDIACVSGTLPCQLITGQQIYNGGLTVNSYTSSPTLTTTFTTYDGGGLSGPAELIDYEIFVSNSEHYKVKLRLTGSTGTDLVLITLTRII